jgi:hypothetical protein
MRARAAAIAVVVVLAGAASSPALGQSGAGPEGLAGLSSAVTLQYPDPTPGHGGVALLSDSTRVLSASRDVLTLEHSTVTTHADASVFRRVVSVVTIPLPQVTLAKVGTAVRFACTDKSSCMGWEHTDYYSEDGADFGKAGTAATYTLNLDDPFTRRLFDALCQSVRCG